MICHDKGRLLWIPEIFVAFVLYTKHGSINKAASQLFINAQGLSRIIRNLESELQVELFVRAANGTTPMEVLHSAIACFPRLWEERTLPMTAALAQNLQLFTSCGARAAQLP